jgi:hypothetical protein
LINKAKHIVDSYIDNALPPKVQIDISSELARKIVDECDFLSPYLFLQANVSIFKVEIKMKIKEFLKTL